MIDILIGLQWGDEGKGKVVDYLAPNYDIIARFQGGPNAGHTLYVEDQKVVLHTVPSGIFHEGTLNLIGNGVVIDPISLQQECEELIGMGADINNKLYIAERAHLILPTHRLLDKASELAKGKEKIGSTLRGIGPTYMDKTGRNGLRVGELLTDDFDEKYQKLRKKHLELLEKMGYQGDLTEFDEGFEDAIEYLRSLNIINGIEWINTHLKESKNILAEGAQGTLLDIDFGTYPYVTSSNTGTAGVLTGLGVAAKYIRDVIGISKVYCTRVGEGPFPTELLGESGEMLRERGSEFGATTGRPRRCGWLDLVALNYACMVNGVTQICLTKADIFDGLETFSICEEYEIDGERTKNLPYDLANTDIKPILTEVTGWKENAKSLINEADLPFEFKEYISYLKGALKTPIKYVSTGPDRKDLVVLRD